jgi:hypothetical protein
LNLIIWNIGLANDKNPQVTFLNTFKENPYIPWNLPVRVIYNGHVGVKLRTELLQGITSEDPIKFPLVEWGRSLQVQGPQASEIDGKWEIARSVQMIL